MSSARVLLLLVPPSPTVPIANLNSVPMFKHTRNTTTPCSAVPPAPLPSGLLGTHKVDISFSVLPLVGNSTATTGLLCRCRLKSLIASVLSVDVIVPMVVSMLRTVTAILLMMMMTMMTILISIRTLMTPMTTTMPLTINLTTIRTTMLPLQECFLTTLFPSQECMMNRKMKLMMTTLTIMLPTLITTTLRNSH